MSSKIQEQFKAATGVDDPLKLEHYHLGNARMVDGEVYQLHAALDGLFWCDEHGLRLQNIDPLGRVQPWPCPVTGKARTDMPPLSFRHVEADKMHNYVAALVAMLQLQVMGVYRALGVDTPRGADEIANWEWLVEADRLDFIIRRAQESFALAVVES